MNILKKIYEWLVWSSANPQKLAMTVKAGLPFLMFFGLGNYVTASDATTLVEMTTNFVVVIGTAVTAILTVYGAGRKIYLTVRQMFSK